MNEYDNREKKEYKITALKIPRPLHTEIKKIAAREGRDMKDIFTEQLEKYAKIHGEGNPAYSLDKFVENADFRAYPALADHLQKRKEWFYNFKQRASDKEVKDLEFLICEWKGLFEQNFWPLY